MSSEEIYRYSINPSDTSINDLYVRLVTAKSEGRITSFHLRLNDDECSLVVKSKSVNIVSNIDLLDF